MEIFKLVQIKTLMMFFILIFSFTPMSEKAFAEQTMNIDRDKSTVLITGSNRGIGLASVSYTHLTLPTIYSV